MRSQPVERVAGGDQRRRVVRHHLPLALGSATALALFLVLPLFDPQAYTRTDMSGVLPRPAPEHAATGESASPTPAATHAGGATPAAGHGADTTRQPEHGGRSTPAPGHGSSPTSSPRGDGQSTAPAADRLTTARLTVATGYVATALLAATLVIGPANLALRRRNPISSYLRRDVGMWTAVFSVVHVFFGLQVHGGGQLAGIVGYFLAPDGAPLGNSFGLGNWTGLAATVIVLALLGISSDLALRGLKHGPWKWIQRLNYALFALVLAHAFFYGALVRVASPFTALLLLTTLTVVGAQAVGVALWRRRQRSARVTG